MDHWCEEGKEKTRLSVNGNKRMLKVFGFKQRKWIVDSKAYASFDFTEMPSDLVEQLYGKMWVSTKGLPIHAPPVPARKTARYDMCANS